MTKCLSQGLGGTKRISDGQRTVAEAYADVDELGKEVGLSEHSSRPWTE